MSMWTMSQRLHLDQRTEPVAGVEVFAGTDRDVDRVRDPGHRLEVAGRHRILQPHRLDRLDRLRHLNGIAHVVLPVRLDAEVDVGAELVAHDLHRPADAPQVLQREPAGIAVVTRLLVVGIGLRRDAVPLELECRPPELLRPGLPDLFAPRLGILRPLDRRHRAIETDPVAKPSAEQVARGRLEDSPGEVPQRDFDAAGGGHGHAGNRAGAGAFHQHLRVQLVDVERIFAKHDRPELVDDEVLHPPAPVRFADPVQPGVRLDLDQVPVPGSADDHALDVRDLDLALVLPRIGFQRQQARRRQPRRGFQESSPVHGTLPPLKALRIRPLQRRHCSAGDGVPEHRGRWRLHVFAGERCET